MKNIKYFIFSFILVFISSSIVFKLFGFIGRYDIGISHKSLSWQEFYQLSPTILLGSLIISFIGTVFTIQYKKSQEITLERERKRIAEREKKEKEQQAEEQRNENK